MGHVAAQADGVVPPNMDDAADESPVVPTPHLILAQAGE